MFDSKNVLLVAVVKDKTSAKGMLRLAREQKVSVSKKQVLWLTPHGVTGSQAFYSTFVKSLDERLTSAAEQQEAFLSDHTAVAAISFVTGRIPNSRREYFLSMIKETLTPYWADVEFFTDKNATYTRWGMMLILSNAVEV